MAAITPTSVQPDIVYGQNFLKGGQIMVLPFTTSGAGPDTWQAPQGMNPVAVAWQSANIGEPVATTLNTTTKVVSFADSAGATSGNLIIVLGGSS